MKASGKPATLVPMSRYLHRCLTTLLIILTLTSALAEGAGADGTYYRLPGASATVSADAITIVYGPYHETYVAGLGWLSSIEADPPLVVEGQVLVNGTVLDALGVSVPRLEGIRYSGGAEVRVVLDFAGLAADSIANLRSGGTREAGANLTVNLPTLLLPAEAPDDVAGLELELVPGATGVTLRIGGPAFDYAVFPLENPTRLVIDLAPKRDLSQLVEVEKSIAPGVDYRRYRVFGASGPSVVHLVSMAPGSGELRVVGESRVPRTVSQLTDGALVGLNAGYFDTSNFAAIGLLKVDYGLQSLPSRGRASVAFSPAGPTLIERLDADVKLHTSRGTLRVGAAYGDGVIVSTTAGALTGNPSQGVLVVRDGVVVENKIGPRLTPKDGFALAYPAVNRDLALLDTGDTVALDMKLSPNGFEEARYAVEAGPLLVRDGAPAYLPSAEGFASGQRILDGLTQQAAIGVMPDGTTLFVVAETMRAEDLVQLFLGLGVDRAMRFDSGSSTTLVVDGKVVNRSSERKVVSAVVFVSGTAKR